MEKPIMLNHPADSELRELLQQHVNLHESGDYPDDSDQEHYIYEAAMEAYFGKNVWKWYNSTV